MITDALNHLTPGEGTRPFTPEELAAVDDVLDAAVEWRAGRLPLVHVWELGTLRPRQWTSKAATYNGGIETTCRGNDHAGYSRFMALFWAVRSGDERRHDLQAALNAADALGVSSPRPEGV